MIKTLYHIPQSPEKLQSEIEVINGQLGFPNASGHTLTYAQAETDEAGNVLPMVITHEAQTVDLSIPLVAKEVIDNPETEVTSDKIKATTETVLNELASNAKNFIVDVAAVRTSATDKPVETLKADGNTIITTSPVITEKYCVVSDEKGVVLSDYVKAGKIETLKTVEQFSDLSVIPANKFEPLPDKGKIFKGKMYDYKGKVVLCIQDHERTIYAPETTPALFSFYRTNSDTLAWIANEKVDVGWKRVYNGKTYVVTQAHMTLESWTPDKTPTLWSVVATSSEWTYPVAYKVNDIVTYQGKTYKVLQAHTSQAGWSPTAVHALFKLQ